MNLTKKAKTTEKRILILKAPENKPSGPHRGAKRSKYGAWVGTTEDEDFTEKEDQNEDEEENEEEKNTK